MPQSVILLADVPGLGQVGDQKIVKEGYARNYLIPNSFAVYATPNAVNKAQRQKGKIEATKTQLLSKAKEMEERVTKVGLVFEKPVGHGGRLFGSVTSLDILEELVRQGASVEKKSVLMHGPLKTPGDHVIRVRIHSQVVVDVPVKIVGTKTDQPDVEEMQGMQEESKEEKKAEETEQADA